jgi:phospholipid/cholesterol/gamma-HCH transport system substrate-binding protein
LPSQKQLHWSELRVGLTVLFAAVTLTVLIFLMSGTTGMFTPKISLKSYFDNASGLRLGAPVRLEGVDIGNVEAIRIVNNKPLTPVEVTMKVSSTFKYALRKDSITTLNTAGVLGETYVDIDSAQAKAGLAENGDVLPIIDRPDFQDVVRSSQSTLQNMQVLLQRLDRILTTVESGQGSVGKLINDPSLYNRLNATVAEMQGIVNKVGQGQGSLGKLFNDDTLYEKANATVDKLAAIADELNQGKGTAGKLLKDPALYDNANKTIAEARQLMEQVNAGKGALGKLARDEEFAKKLDNTVTKLSLISDRLEAGEGSAGKLLKDQSLYNNADQMLVESRELVKAIRQDPKKYLSIKLHVF